ncbi:minor capsid protein [Actinosynnema sp. NPDC050801]|uniref:minor capsid protein n=1 Tax=unclassified Actinosynnema TaxID=2637065 RepID=UPI00340E3CC9
MSWTTRLAHGLAELLADAGVAVYRPTGVYRDDEVGIVVGIVPTAPPSVLVLTPYPLTDDVDQADSVLGLQLRARSAGPDPRPALDLLDAVFDELQGATHLNLGGALVHLAQRTASVPLSRDQSGRYEHADTYQLMTHRPTRHRS